MQEQHQTCALRALTLCDGQVLEDPDRALTGCLCTAIADSYSAPSGESRAHLVQERQRLIERTMAL